MKKYPFTNAVIFALVMENENVCKKLIERVINRKIKRLTKIEPERSIFNGIDTHSIRLDVLAEDEDGRLFDIEMQTGHFNHLPLRFRGYQSIIDGKYWRRGNKYKELRETYIIFFCTNDPFKKGLPVYEFEPICKQDPKLKFDSRTHWLVLNAKAYDSAVEHLSALLKYMATGKTSSDSLVKEIDKEVDEINHNAEKRGIMATVNDLIRDEKRDLEKRLEARHKLEIEQMEQARKDEVKQIEQKHSNEVAQIKKDYNKKVEELEKQLAELKTQKK